MSKNDTENVAQDEAKAEAAEVTSNTSGSDASKNDWSQREIGALWRKGADRPYYSGTIRIGEDNFEIVIFPNKYKEKENHPDLRIYKSKPATELIA